MSNQLHLDIPSEMASLDQVNAFVEGLKNWAGLEDDVFMNLMMAANEAACNAILHGNRLDPKKTVRISAERFPDRLQLDFQDQGNGFDPDRLPDPTEETNLLKSGGRGIFIIRAYADTAEFLDSGRLVRLTFRR